VDLHHHQPVHTRGRYLRRVILPDGLALSGLMVRYNIGVQDQQTYVIKRVDEDFFEN
jgi:restriction system protein